MTKTAFEVVNEIEQRAASSEPTPRVLKSMATGEVVRQGDLYLERLTELPRDLGKRTEDRQLAVGQTQGSRHVVDPAPKGLAIYARPEGATALVGPVVSSPKRFRLTHPEHGHFSLPAGVYQVRYQRDFAKERAEEIRRVAD